MRVPILTIFLLFSFHASAQEICNNGIDDNGNDLVDIIDGGCRCNSAVSKSLIPNHDFEDYTSCPNGSSQLYKAFPWVQGTSGNPSYINRCGYVLPDFENYPTNNFIPNDEIEYFPSGNGIAGAIMSSPYSQYIKSTLTTPIPAQTDAQLSISVAAIIYKNNAGPYEMEVEDLEPMDLTIYGSPIINDLPFLTNTNPDIPGSPWIKLGTAVYVPKPNWHVTTINFTTPIEIREVMIGAPESLPDSYYVPLMHIGSYPYFLYDEVIVNTLAESDAYITRSGSLCSDDMSLTVHLSNPTTGNVAYQWFKESIPVYVNGSSPTLDISNSIFAVKDGTYEVIIYDDTNCYKAYYTLNLITPNPTVKVKPPSCNNPGTILITSIADEYSIDNGETWSTDPFFDPVLAGTYLVVTKTDGCVSSIRNVIVPARAQNLPAPLITTNQPDSCADIGDIIVNAAAALYSFDNGETWTSTNTLEDAPAGDYLVLMEDETGCRSLAQAITLESFTNNYAPPSGDPEQYFCISENATVGDINLTGLSILWYDAPTGGNLLPTSTPVIEGQTYYASQSVNNCESITRFAVTTFISTTLNAAGYETTICANDNDENVYINLSDFNSNLTPSTTFIFQYYNSLNGAENQILDDEIFNFEDFELLIGGKTIYVRISNQGGCFKIVELLLNMVSPPLIDIKDNIALCEGKDLTINAGIGFDEYLWSTNETTPSITVNQPGNYTVTVSENHENIVCTSTKTFTVFSSNTATITEILNSDWNNDKNTIVIMLSENSIGDYEYSLDGINFQESNTFSELNGGEHIVYVRDKNNCGIIDKTIYLLMFPKYFTPNGDSFNDTWGVKFLKSVETYTTEIYDRYGRLLKTLKNSETWDGNFNGKQLPSTDYWFQISSSDGKSYRSHFSLKR
ncbi:T9SS type B sorting domain-containing protein [Flavobacterium soli]|uniref:T9SS type B sorting domain-containing protein n=1 Tax=Flavobacterium soli TaxID=344881 RepID=UPI00047DEC39|nr:T9SS type B sorting domain-containing protein [Flavobacterium soli]